jgi:hypothetical protein
MRSSLAVLLLAILSACGEGAEAAGRPAAPDTAGDFVGQGQPQADSYTRVPCDTAPHEPTRYVTVRVGELSAEVPPEWHIHHRTDQHVGFSVPSMSDPDVKARTTVMVALVPMEPGRTLQATSDAMLSNLTNDPKFVEVFADTMPDADHRYFWWHGVAENVSYSNFNNFGRAGQKVVPVMISLALGEHSADMAALEAFSRDSDHLLSSMTVDGRRVFPGWTMHPTAECAAPSS